MFCVYKVLLQSLASNSEAHLPIFLKLFWVQKLRIEASISIPNDKLKLMNDLMLIHEGSYFVTSFLCNKRIRRFISPDEYAKGL